MNNVELYIEALIFSSEQSLRLEEILYCLQGVFEQDFDEQQILNHINNIRIKYRQDDFAI